MHNDTVIQVATPDLTNYYAGHDAMRRSNEMLVAGIADTELGDRRRIQAIHRWYAGYAGELRTHHRNEDEIYFPALAHQVGIFHEYEQSLADDHADLHDLIERLEAVLLAWSDDSRNETARERSLALAINLRDLLAGHLDEEDRDILPLIERHISVEEYAQLEQQMLKQLDIKQALFTVPWIIHGVSAEQRATMWALAPTGLKIVFRLTNRRYRKLVATAFGVTL